MLAWDKMVQGPARLTVSGRADLSLSDVKAPELVETLTSLALGAVRG